MSSPHRFVVRGQVYTPADAAGVRRVLPEKHDRLATFPKAEAAFADCANRLAECRRATNPFQLGGPCLFYQTNLPAFAFHDYLLDHGITPPPTSLTANPNYVFWWVRSNRNFTDREREVVWTACDKLKPFDVLEEDDRQAVYVVVEVPWPDGGDGGWLSVKEGGDLRRAFRRIRNARRYCDSLNTAAREETAGEGDWRPDGELADVLMADDLPLATVATVPAVAATGDRVSLLVRQAFDSLDGGYPIRHDSWAGYNLGARVPLTASGSAGTATGVPDGPSARVRRTVNPFALLSRDDLGRALLDGNDIEHAYLPNGLTIDDAIEIVRKLPTVPPAPEVLTADWYDRVAQRSPEFVDVIWSTFADFRLFEVIEVPFD